jgi:hypothetical protein
MAKAFVSVMIVLNFALYIHEPNTARAAMCGFWWLAFFGLEISARLERIEKRLGEKKADKSDGTRFS